MKDYSLKRMMGLAAGLVLLVFWGGLAAQAQEAVPKTGQNTGPKRAPGTAPLAEKRTGQLAEKRTEPKVVLRFVQKEGDVYHADALVRESVLINGVHWHDAEITETSVSRVLGVDEGSPARIESARLEVEFRTSERVGGRPGMWEWLSSETVELVRDADGSMTVPDDAIRPVLRDIPVFPVGGVEPGSTWAAPAEEVHVFRIGGGLFGPYRGNTMVSYTYEGDEWHEGRHLALIRMEYGMHVPVRKEGEPVRLVSGRSSQLLRWDVDAGQPWRKDEEFDFLIFMADGTTHECVGTQVVTYRRDVRLDRDTVVESLKNELKAELTGDLADEGIQVESTSRGVLLRMNMSEMVLFTPESSVISPSERNRLEELARLLEDFGDRDILITGHTAHFGTEEGRRELSLSRASAVAEILFPGLRRKGLGKLYIQGMGSKEPRGTDAENRRVEIMIMD